MTTSRDIISGRVFLLVLLIVSLVHARLYHSKPEAPRLTEVKPVSGALAVYTGQNTRLTCRATGSPKPFIRWYHYGYLIHMRTQKRYSMIKDYSLLIEDVRHTDNGHFTCRVSNIQGEVSHNFTLTVLEVGPPVWSQAMAQDLHFVHYTAGFMDKELQCLADGRPQPNIDWFKNNKLIEFPQDEKGMTKNRIRKERRSGSLVLHSVRLEDQGNYTCRASNKHGFIEWTYIVNVVSGLAYPPEITLSLENQTVKAGDRVQLVCEANSLTGVLTWLWIKYNHTDRITNDSPYVILKTPTDPQPSELLLANITDADAGWYGCVARNPLGLTESRAYLHVNKQDVQRPRSRYCERDRKRVIRNRDRDRDGDCKCKHHHKVKI